MCQPFFLFVMLAVTGYFMTLYCVPSPEQAYDAVDYLTYEVPLGYVVRGVHHWSANLMIVTIIIHMIRVFVYGAYKNPREINWMTGVCLFCLVMAFGFTGYLLPWDQKAYWATKVGTSIMGSVPLVGEYALRLMRGGENLGALTMTRFYLSTGKDGVTFFQEGPQALGAVLRILGQGKLVHVSVAGGGVEGVGVCVDRRLAQANPVGRQ